MFGHAQTKLEDSHTQLERMKSARDAPAFRASFSGFLTAGRAVTNALQKQGKRVLGFRGWYETRREEMKNRILPAFAIAIGLSFLLALAVAAQEAKGTGANRAIPGIVPADPVTRTVAFQSSTSSSLSYATPITFTPEFTTHLPLVVRGLFLPYFDDFGDPNSGWATGESEYTIYGYLNGEYQVYLKQENSWSWITPGKGQTQDLVLPSDYRVEVNARKVSAGACSYGLRFGQRYTSDSYETYQVIVYPTAGEFYLNKRTLDGSWSVITDWTYSSAINQNGGTNHIAVERIGSTIKLYMNGSQVANVTDSSFVGSGRDAGFVAYSYGDAPVDVRFDNFSASQQ